MSIDEERIIFYWEIEPISVAFFDSAWSYQNDEAEEQAKSKALQGQIEEEVRLPVGITSIGTGAAAPGFLIMLPSMAFGGAIWLFKGKEIKPNIEA